MIKLLASNVSGVSKSDITVIGFPDESKSDARDSGVKMGPDALRKAFNDSQYFQSFKKKIPVMPMSGNLNKKIFDYGNISRDKIYQRVFSICSIGKIPITLGGDHSLTAIALRAIRNSLGKKISLLYFDAHPDFLSSIQNFHGSVLFDAADCIDFSKSMVIGMRAAEPEEILNIKKNNLECLTPIEIMEEGLPSIARRLVLKCGFDGPVYTSIDLDCIDPGIAPGVSVPAVAGLMPLEVIFLVKKICSNLRVTGLDIVELSPKFDVNNNTANIAARLLMESIASLPSPKSYNKSSQK